jgi:hypothetical protein
MVDQQAEAVGQGDGLREWNMRVNLERGGRSDSALGDKRLRLLGRAVR